MALRESTATGFLFGPTICRFIPKNADGGYADPTRVVSSTSGPFDFSDAAVPAAVTVTLKLDDATAIAETLDLSAVADIAAVTVAELATAWTAASVAGYTGTAEAVTGYFKIAKTTPGTAKYLQIGGEVALYTGMPVAIIPVNTQVSVAIEQVNKDGERISIIDSNGLETAVITDTYPTGANITVTDSVYDQNIRALVEGGTLETVAGYTNKRYQSAGPGSTPGDFVFEAFNSMYARDDSQRSNIKSYRWRRYKAVKGYNGGESGDQAFQTGVYTLAAVPYLDPITSVKETFVYEEYILTPAEFTALKVKSV
jgi:hypothetical protein